jgi:hypothetical protein
MHRFLIYFCYILSLHIFVSYLNSAWFRLIPVTKRMFVFVHLFIVIYLFTCNLVPARWQQ